MHAGLPGLTCAAAFGVSALAATEWPDLLRQPDSASVVACSDTPAVVDRAISHVDLLGKELGSVIATERYIQELGLPAAGGSRLDTPAPPVSGPVTAYATPPLAERPSATHTIQSEFLFVRLPDDDQTWLGFRDVQRVNGRRVDAARRAAIDVPGETGLDRWQRLSEESARYNIGAPARTTNVPTFALVVLHPRNRARFSFTSRLESRARDPRCVVVFQETSSPTIVRSAIGAALPASGSFLVEPSSGRIEQSELVVGSDAAGVASQTTVTYALDKRLRLWLPKEMHEVYVSRGSERVTGVAKYSNYRRGDVAVRIVP